MELKKLTKRQIELLHIIEDFLNENAVPPTIVELKKRLKVKSDQSVYQLLEKLEEARLIQRERGKRRSIRLVKQEPKSITPEINKTLPPSDSIPVSFSFNPVQKEIYKRLHEIDPRLGIIFKGGMYTLAQKDFHPDWIPPVANAIRHIFCILTRGQSGSTATEKIGASLDPQGGVVSIEDRLWKRWNGLNKEIGHKFAHYGDDYYNQEKEFIKKIELFYELLLQYVLPSQNEIYKKIDKIFRKKPRNELVEEIRHLCRDTSSYTYFFDHVPRSWFNLLKENNLLKPTRQVGQYLIRISPKQPDSIISLIENYDTIYKTDGKTRSIRQYFIQSACAMPADKAAKIVFLLSKQKWIQDVQGNHDFLLYEVKNLLEILIKANQKTASLLLIKEVLTIRKSPKDSFIEGVADNHQYGEIVECLKKAPVEDLEEYIRILIDILKQAIQIANDKGIYTQTWRTIEKSEFHLNDEVDILIDGIISLLKKFLIYAQKKKLDIPILIEDLLGAEHTILNRIKLYLYKEFADDCKKQIPWKIIDHFDEYGTVKEYDELLTQEFGKLDKIFQEKYLELVEKGPEDKKKKEDGTYLRYWKIRKLFLVKDNLDEKWQKIYTELLNGEDEEKYKPIYSGMSTTIEGPTAPQSAEELSAMSLDNLIDYLITWTPKKGFAEPSRMGLGRELVEVIKNEPKKYSENAMLFQNESLHVVYLYHYFFGLREAVRNGEQIDWKPVLELMRIIIDRAKEDSLPTFEIDEDDWNIHWGNCFQYIADLLENGLSLVKLEIPENFQAEVWEIIKYLCEDNEPDLNYENKYGGENSSYYHLSINTTRGEAFHALFNYIFWYDRHFKKKGMSRIPNEVKEVLENHLDITKEPGFTIRSVYGRFFPWLYIYDKEWTKDIIDKLFPLDDIKRRYAAWDTYIFNAVYPEIFEKLRPQYEKALDELRKTSLQKNKRSKDIFKRLVEHLMIAYFYEIIEYDDPLLQKLDEVANQEQKGWAVNFGGKAYIASNKESREKEPSKERLKLFWEKRLKECRSVEELKEFGEWLRVDFFDNKWMLENLLETLKQTKGIINPEYHTLDMLDELSEKHPLLISKCLLKIVKAQYQDRFLRLTREKSVLSIVEKLYRNDDNEVRKLIAKVCDHMLRLGNNDFRKYL